MGKRKSKFGQGLHTFHQLPLSGLRFSFWFAATPQPSVNKRGWVGAPTQELTPDGTLRLAVIQALFVCKGTMYLPVTSA